MRLAATLITAGALCLLPLATRAEPAPPPPAACAAMDAALPAELAGWSTRAALVSAANPAGLAQSRLVPGKAVSGALHPTPAMTFVVQPSKPTDGATHGGMFAFQIDQPGTYVIALSAGAWIDVAKDGQAVAPSAHAHGSACSTVHKMVDYALQPGRYVLQLSASPDATVAILLARRP